MRHVAVWAAQLSLSVLLATAALAEASGPDTWDIVGVAPDDKLNVHTAASASSPVIAGIPAGTRGLRNLGCTPAASFQQWLSMSEAERALSGRARWCKVVFEGRRGWVAGRFLREGGAAGATDVTSVGPWTVRCAARPCVVEQQSVGRGQSLLMRIAPREAGNAEFTFERAALPRQGVMKVYVDGRLITAGPVAPFRNRAGTQLVMTPDDLTLGLLRGMSTSKTMAIELPGGAGGIEYHLEQLPQALEKARSQ